MSDSLWHTPALGGVSNAQLVALALVWSVPWFALHAVLRAAVAALTPHNKALRALAPEKRAGVHSYMVSTVHAVLAFCLAAHTLAHAFADGPLWGAREAPVPRAAVGTAAVSAGYFVYDLWSISLSIPSLWGVDTLVHHTQWLFAAWVCLRNGFGAILMWSLTLEASTPFVNGIFLGKALGAPKAVELANGAALVLVFGGRIVPWIPFWVHHLATHWAEYWHESGLDVKVLCTVTSVAGTVLNSVWYSKILRGFAKALAKSAPKKTN